MLTAAPSESASGKLSLLAVDAGQTGIRVRSRHPRYFEQTFPGAITSRPLLPQLADVVVSAAQLAGRAFPVVVIGTTGLTEIDNDPRLLLELCREAGTTEVRLAHDSVTSYLAALGLDPGVVVAAGTGVVTLGVGATGTARVDGWGYLLGDAGSGYWLGRAGLDHALRAFDGRGQATALTAVLLDAFPRPEEAYIDLQTDPDKVRRVAVFARAVCDLAATDEVAAAICRQAGEELAQSAAAAAARVDLGANPRVCLIGGVFGADAVRKACVTSLRRRLPDVRLLEPLGEGIDGAEELARVGDDHPLAGQVARASHRLPHALFRVEAPLRDYAWGSLTDIPELLGRPPDGRPQAELWLGAHPAAPATVDGVGLDELLASHPEPAGGSLPFLMKVLAAGRPLSLQVHPDRHQAEVGFERENAAGLAVGDPRRSYADPEHKPEMIVAITPFVALTGFRAPVDAARDLAELTDPGSAVAAELLGLLRSHDRRAALRDGFKLILSGRPEVRELAAAVVAAASTHPGRYADTVRRAGDYGDDPGVLAAALLNRVDLQPGEAVYLAAGNVHAYLQGLGIEAMAPSDNVLRGGLTPKHIDVSGLLEIVSFATSEPERVAAVTTEDKGISIASWWPPAEEFSVHRITGVGGPRELAGSGPAMLIVTEGSLELASGGERLTLERGQSAFHAGGRALSVSAPEGTVTAYLTTLGRPG